MILIDTDHLSVLSNRLARGHDPLVRRTGASADQEFAIPVVCVEESIIRGQLKPVDIGNFTEINANCLESIPCSLTRRPVSLGQRLQPAEHLRVGVVPGERPVADDRAGLQVDQPDPPLPAVR